ncbi:molybdenum ABC transporter ATP-binding protein [Clostridium thermosuccinogenes]|uniref:Molybdenum ABC transporter ATP-binding protein n=1 Tax=Clostridium thermosuccinogenes TaxID=84032 RepID=A0A2K2EW97_9CLOT|nr:molybdenum ABC transporter ATP-binding protein [Pseudoclostridium thermosuccinogenes]PNT90806.1 molybdenum ABC transporter ATP-binding protein [Pseudoclostridium thermosuccinogenes]PNT95978.1 molybdenum ABC transporter ATP-binding protein [Pseudoclostridium thermosuccinogenes]PNT97405.1 molybdenum ABC transporter ATP-binding protein [Pseudoclostridium thermosuccinogenes]
MVVEANQVSVIRNNKYILKDISWSFKRGEHWAILGLNGSGKTTLLNVINGYVFPSRGEIQVLGKTFGKYDWRELRKSIGWVSTALQERLYKSESAEDIVISGRYASIGLYEEPSQEDRALARDILEQLGCRELSLRTYETLSQGEKQLVLIARALMASPRLLILDEPCTGLDIFAKEKLLSIIGSFSSRPDAPAMIYVTHVTEEILPTFSHTLLLRRGQVHSSGETAAMMTKENLEDFYEIPVRCENLGGRFLVRPFSYL